MKYIDLVVLQVILHCVLLGSLSWKNRNNCGISKCEDNSRLVLIATWFRILSLCIYTLCFYTPKFCTARKSGNISHILKAFFVLKLFI